MKVRFKSRYIFLGVLLIIISEPEYFKIIENRTWNTFFVSSQIILGILFSLYFFSHRKIKNKVSLYLIILDIWILAVTIIRQGAVYAAFSKLYILFILVLIYEYFESDKKTMVGIFMWCMELLIYTGLADVIIHPSGITEGQWILGGQNDIIRYLLPAYCLAVLYDRIYRNRIRAVALICAINYIAVVINSSTTIVGILIMDVALLIKCTRKIIDLRIALIMTVIAFGLVVVSQNIFISSIITDFFGKSITFHGRTPIWQYVTGEIIRHPFIGNGRGNFQISSWYVASHTHCFILEIAYRSGIIGIILLFLAIRAIIIKMEKNRESIFYPLLSAALFSFFVMGIVEVHEYHLMYLIFLIAYDIQDFNNLVVRKSNVQTISECHSSYI